jgi:hypothetical protein
MDFRVDFCQCGSVVRGRGTFAAIQNLFNVGFQGRATAASGKAGAKAFQGGSHFHDFLRLFL